MAQVFLEKHESNRIAEEAAYVEPKDLSNTELGEDIDALLADIDDILTDNEAEAQALIDGFVQKGGE